MEKLELPVTRNRTISIPIVFFRYVGEKPIIFFLKVNQKEYKMNLRVHQHEHQAKVTFPKQIHDLLNKPKNVHLIIRDGQINITPILTNNEGK